MGWVHLTLMGRYKVLNQNSRTGKANGCNILIQTLSRDCTDFCSVLNGSNSKKPDERFDNAPAGLRLPNKKCAYISIKY